MLCDHAIIRLRPAPLLATYSVLLQDYRLSETDDTLQNLLKPVVHYLTNRALALK